MERKQAVIGWRVSLSCQSPDQNLGLGLHFYDNGNPRIVTKLQFQIVNLGLVKVPYVNGLLSADVTSVSCERVQICKTMYHVQSRIKRREMKLQAERTVESARLPKWTMGSGGYGRLRETIAWRRSNQPSRKQRMLTRYFGNNFASTTNPALPDWIHRRWNPCASKITDL